MSSCSQLSIADARLSSSPNKQSDVSSSSSIASSKSSVTFGTANVREYERVLGGRPDVPMALNLGWNYREHRPMSVDEFEYYSAQDRLPDCQDTSQTSVRQRFAILHYVHGFTLQELQDAENSRLKDFDQLAEPISEKNVVRGGIWRKLRGLGKHK